MTVNERIIAALAPLGVPVVPDLYAGEATTYITFNYDVLGGLFADDRPWYDVYLVQVHLLAPYGWDSVGLRRRIKGALFDAGFTWPEETDAGSGSRAKERAGQHIVFECERQEGVDDG